MSRKFQFLTILLIVGSILSIYLIDTFRFFFTPRLNSNDLFDGRNCVMTAESLERFGNNLFEYATLYALAKLNKCKAIVSPAMGSYVKSCFLITTETKETADQSSDSEWQLLRLDHLMSDEYKRIANGHNASLVKLTGFPTDWRFFVDYDQEIRNEFTFYDNIQTLANNFLQTSRKTTSSNENVTFIGVHVRRTDYIKYLKKQNCEVAGPGYLHSAMTLMHSRYPDSIFIIASDDIKWCQKVMSGFDFKTVFVPNTYSACTTMAVLGHCNHSIMTQGTFGFWGAYLAKGDAVYYSNYCNNKTDVLHKFRGNHLEHWIAIPAVVDDKKI